jgi:PAS domain S-box-containing protein
MVNGQPSMPCILVVDDIPDTLELISNWLELHSFQTIQATSGPQALKLAAEEQPDLILLDVMMPKMDGIETCRQLKANAQTNNIPVILVTAKDPVDARADGLFAGAVDYIAKPVNLPDLVSKVEAALTTERNTPMDAQRLLEEAAHTALTILGGSLVWLLALDADNEALVSKTLVTNSSSVQENDFLLKAGRDQSGLRFPLSDPASPLTSVLASRRTLVNIPARRFQEAPTTVMLYEAIKQLHLPYLTIIPLVAVGRTVGLMVLGSQSAMETDAPRTQQILTALGNQAAIAVDYARLMHDLEQHEAEQQSEQAFRQMILDTMSDALVVIDASGAIKYFNQRLLRMTGYTRQALEGQSVGNLFHPDDREEIMIGLLRENATTMKFDQRLVTSDGRVIPILMSRSRSHRRPLDNQVIVLSDMTEQKVREAALERQTSRLMALNKAAQTIASNLSLHETLQDILDSAIQVVEAQGASLFLVNKENNEELFVVAAVGYKAADLINLRIPLGEGLAGWVAREAQPALVSDLSSDPRFYRGVDEQTGMDSRSLIAVPLIRGNEVFGVIEVVNKLNDGVFDLDDMRLLESMAGTAAVSIINARLFDQSQRRVAELATLLSASEAASSTLEMAVVLEHIVRSLASSLEVSHCLLMAWNAPKNSLETLADLSDVFWEESSGPQRPYRDGSAVYRALHQQTPVVASLRAPDLHLADQERLEASGMIHMMALPITLRDQFAGVAVLYSNDSYAGYHAGLVDQAAAIIHNWQRNLTVTNTLKDVSYVVITDLVDQLGEIPATAWVAIHDWQQETGQMRLIRERGFAEWTKRRSPRLPIEYFPTMQAAISENRLQITTLDTLPPDSPEHDWLKYRGGRSWLLIPLFSHGIAIGLVVLIDINQRRFDDQEINLAQSMANVVSNAMENARLYDSLQSRAKALESAYKELQDADHAKDQFIQNISHELRTPLIHVLGYAELLAEETFGEINQEQREALQTIAAKAQHVADIVEDMVAAQAQALPTLDRQPVDLTAVITDVLQVWGSQIAETGLQVITHFPDNVPAVYADPKLIKDAFEKLLSNALKFGAEGERIEIMVRNTETTMVQVAVRDYGIGIDPSEHHKVFQRFYQVDGGTNRRYGGAGLGLAVAKSIIESHSGRIGVKSRPNEGSIFFFTLPKFDYIQR